MGDKLYDATRAYNNSLRWGDFDRAAEHLPPESADSFLERTEGIGKEIVVIDFQMTRLKLDKQKGMAASRVHMSWHTDTRLIVEETTVDQLWQFYEGSWYLVDERRIAGEPIDLFPVEKETDESDDEHAYLPGLVEFRKTREIGLDEKEKRRRDKERRKQARAAKRAARKSGASPQEDPAENFGFDPGKSASIDTPEFH